MTRSDPPTVSVGMPVYNGEPYIQQAIESILDQDFDDFELVICDNASQDSTEAVVRDYMQKDDRIRYFRNEKNIGASDNYNAVFKHSRGRYFKWASSNDYCDQGFLRQCVEALEQQPDVVLAYPRTRLFSDSLEDYENYADGLDLREDSPCDRLRSFLANVKLNNVMNGMIRSEILRTTPLIKVFYSSDVNLMGELALHGKFVELSDYLFYRRMDKETATKLKSDKEVLKHYDPQMKNPMAMQSWKMHREYFAAVARVPMDREQKWCAYGMLVRRLFWDRADLLRELIQVARPAKPKWLS